MALPRPEQVIIDVESVVREYLRPATAISVSPAGDLPPKYEDLEDFPPQYDESTMRNDAALEVAVGGDCVNDATNAAAEESASGQTEEAAKASK